MHDSLIYKVLMAPINLFYDVTPIGKVLNRFSKDLSVIDTQLCFSLGGLLACFYLALSALVVAIVAVKWILIEIFFLGLFAILLFRFTLKAYKECYRVETVTKSPVLSFL